jgi:hypothetical protein
VSTTLLPSALRGSQKPRVLTRPPFATEDAGQEAIDLAESVGLYLDPWQQLIVRVALAEDDRGLYAAREVGYLVARQNGKGAAMEAIALHGLFLVGDPVTLWTAHETKTSGEAFIRMKGWVDGSDDLRRLVKRINNSHGEEGIELLGGQRLRFLARSKSSGRGFSPQRIFFDEAQELPKVATEAMLPSMRAQRNRQAIYTGTVPGPDINNPDHWTRLRDRGRAGSGRLAWIEWTPKGSADPEVAEAINLDDETVWAAANPGAGYRDGLDLDTLAADREALDDDSFGRECLSIWPQIPELDLDSAFGKGRWSECAVEMPTEPPLPTAIGVAVSLDRAWTSIAAVSDAQRPHLGSVQRSRGTAWVAAEAKRIQDVYDCAIVIDSRGPASGLIEEIEGLGGRVSPTSTAEYLDACATLFDAVAEKAVEHANYDELNTAVGVAQKRDVGDRWAWARKGGDVSMLEAATLAFWARPSVYDERDMVIL